MTRLLIAALFLALAAAPAFANCDGHKSAGNQPGTVASQPSNDHSAPSSVPAQRKS